MTDTAERLKKIRADWSTYCHPGEDLRPAVYARHRLLDAVPFLLDQLDRSVGREAAALATPPERLARLEALADVARQWVTTELLPYAFERDIAVALADLDATGQEAPGA